MAKQTYLEKHAVRGPFISQDAPGDLEVFLVIPAYNESNIVTTLKSLSDCDIPAGSVEVLVVVNSRENENEEIKNQNKLTYRQVLQWAAENDTDWLKLYCVLVDDLSSKKGGVGLARKMGMDEGVRRFDQVGKNGLIVNLDADCSVDKNYFTAIQSFFRKHDKLWSGGVHFEHIETPNPHEVEAIRLYELHLRYFIDAQRWTRLPFAYQTIGSCMVVRSDAYQKRGGMNVRKAGEDFYFLHKFIDIYRHGDILTTNVRPSGRVSDRVPFGTGKAIGLQLQGYPQSTYAFEGFETLADLRSSLPMLFETGSISHWLQNHNKYLANFLRDQLGVAGIEEMLEQTRAVSTFEKRFFQWFNAFRLMKYLHDVIRPAFPDQPVPIEAAKLQQILSGYGEELSLVHLLDWYRDHDRNTRYTPFAN